MKIAHFGAFDSQSYADLVLPLVLQSRLHGLCGEFVHVSLAGGSPVLEDCAASLSSGEFLRGGPDVDAVILSGGGFSGTTPTELPGGADDVFPALAAGSLWTGAAYAAARDELSLCWNAPGLEEEPTPLSLRLACWTASVSDYVSVRDRESRSLLSDAGVEQKIQLAPDPVLDLPGIWSAQELEEAYDRAFASRSLQTPERVLIFDLSAARINEEPGEVAAALDTICERAQATPVILDLENLHGGLHRELARSLRNTALLLDEPRSLREITACIARSEAYLGSSPRSALISSSFGKPALHVAPKAQRSEASREQLGVSLWQAESWGEAREISGEFLSSGEQAVQPAKLATDEHWECLRKHLLRPEEPGARTENKREAIAELRSITEQYLGEDALPDGTAAERLLRAQEEISRLEQRNAKLERWMQAMDEQVPALLGSHQWRAGRLLHELYRRLRRRPRVPTAAAHLVNTLGQYRNWRYGSEAGPVKIPESSLETRARRLLELAESNRGLPRTLRSVAGRTVASGKRKARLQYKKLQPRLSKEELAGKIRDRLGPVPQLESWPSVSVVVLNRNGLSYLRNLFAGLEHKTDYPSGKLEVIVVDNASTDGSVEFARSLEQSSLEQGFSVRVVQNSENVSFSEGNNQGAQLAGGELLLFANNDIEPFESGWLAEMIALHAESEDAVVGARLVYPRVTEHDTPSGPAASGYALQHRGVGFRKASGEQWHRNIGMGEDALDERLGVDEQRPAITAACMLVGKPAFESVEGFSGGYRYGSEDVDLCLKLLSEGKEVICSGRAVLFHDESPSQKAEGRRFMRENRSANRQMFFERWGPELNRRCALERLAGVGGSEDGGSRYEGGYWTFEGTPHIALTVTSNDPRDGYGDWHTAHEMGDALEASGWRVTYVERKGERWYELPEDLDYLLVLIDLYDISKIPEGVTTIAWVRNWTERWVSHPWFEDYDVVLASSGGSKRIIEENTAKSVDALFPIASNPARFSPVSTEPDYEADYVFTGNFWGELRGVVDAVEVGQQETFRIFGKGWEHVPRVARYARGALPYDEMPKVYSSAKLVIDDTASPTLPYGAVNSRVFDSLATGTLVVTNCEAGVRELFDEDFPTYYDRQSLRAELDRLLANPERREELAARYQRMVLEEHTYEKRAHQLEEILRQRAQATSFCIKIGAPNAKEAQNWGDTHYARAMRRQLEVAGHPCTIQTLDQWDSLEGLACDVAIHLKGLTPYATKPSQINVLWNISHPEQLTAAECDKYDLVFVASSRWAAVLTPQTDTPVHSLQQATDPQVFYPDHDAYHDHDLVFVGNSRKVRRRILRDLLSTGASPGSSRGYDLAVWGKDWEGLIDKRYVVGEYLPNDEVRKAYSSAAIVLNDHWDDMREHGFISNRIYDALASGAFVISDRIQELEQEFAKAIVTYESPEELKELVSYYLAHPQERKRRGERGREIVLQNHTFEKRMMEISIEVSALERPASGLPAGRRSLSGRSR